MQASRLGVEPSKVGRRMKSLLGSPKMVVRGQVLCGPALPSFFFWGGTGLRTGPTRVVSELFTEMPGQRWDMDRRTENGIKA